MIVVEADGFRFEFDEAIEAFVFDETDISKPTYHGAPMKGVDIVAEFEEAYIYVEIKDYDEQGQYDVMVFESDEEKSEKQKAFRWLKNYLKYKFRDSYLYRHAENKVDKPIHYVCLLTFDNALNSRMKRSLTLELPVGKKSSRWNKALVQSCQVVNMDKWNENFPKWPVARIT
jgi:hypothetical protein